MSVFKNDCHQEEKNMFGKMKTTIWALCAVVAMALGLWGWAAAEGLPAYAYTGDDPVERAVIEWMTDSERTAPYTHDESSVIIPAPVILKTEQVDDAHMKVYGKFWLFSYVQREGTLFSVSGGENPGVLTLERDGEGWKATAQEMVGDGENYPVDIVRISNGDEALQESYFSMDQEALRTVRARLAADYVTANALPVVALQDPYWDPIALFAAEKIVGTLEDDGSYTIRVPVRAGEPGEWMAGDVADGDAVRLVSAGMVDGEFVASYAAANESVNGDAVVTLRHYTDNACDQVQSFELRVSEGRIAEVTGGSVLYTTPGDELDPYVSGQWMEKDTQFTRMKLSRNETRGWNMVIESPMTHGAYVLKANVYYDCELEALVWQNGARYDLPTEGTDLGDPVETEIAGRLALTWGEDGTMTLSLIDSQSADAPATVFVRAE